MKTSTTTKSSSTTKIAVATIFLLAAGATAFIIAPPLKVLRLPVQQKFSCAETDGGANFNIKGSTTEKNLTYPVSTTQTDTCNSGILAEYYCDNNRIASKTSSCNCVDGACVAVPAVTCADTDGGVNFNVKGTVSEKKLANNSTVSQTDKCERGALVEYYCENNKAVSKTNPCNCVDGACVAAPVNSILYINKAADSPSGRSAPGISSIVAKFVLSAANKDVAFNEITFNYVVDKFTVSSWELYDGAAVKLGTSGTVINAAQVKFSGFSTIVPANSSKTFFLRADTTQAAYNSSLTAFVKDSSQIKSDAQTLNGLPLYFGTLQY